MTPPTSHHPPPPRTTPEGRRPDESMTLLTSMMERPLDPGYAAAAQRRTDAGLPGGKSTRTPMMLVAALVVGLLLSLGALSLRGPDTAASRTRQDLVRQIEARRADADAQARQAQSLQAEIDRAQANALGGQQAALAQRLAALTLAAGSEAVTGPGLKLTLDDARGSAQGGVVGDPRSGASSDDGRVLSKDLQIVTNALWEAGAEAISINGQRLTARSAIRFAGDAILVNYRPLTRPYVISAIGDPQNLQVEFADNEGGSYVRALEDNYGVRVTMAGAKKLTLPGAPALTVRNATKASAPPTGTPSSTGTPSTSDQTPTTTEPAQ